MKKGTQKLFGTMLILALILSLGVTFAFQNRAGGDEAYVAANYGSVDADDLWYYEENALDVYRARAAVNGWKSSLQGTAPIVIAVVDTGLSIKHELFEGVLLEDENGVPLGYNSATQDGNITDNSTGNHGDKTAGVIAMLIHEFGLEDYIKIYPIKASVRKIVSGKETDTFSIESVTEAIRRANGVMKADVINMSFGRLYSETTAWAENTELKMAIKEAAKTSLMVAAAGNNLSKADSATDPGAFYPAAFDGVLSVMGYNRSGTLWRGSSTSGSNYGALYDIAAPADGIYSAAGVYGQSSYGYENGTSMASPFVAFAAALLKLRYIAEGNAVVNPYTVGRTLRSFAYETFEYSGTKINRLDLNTLASQGLDDVVPNYSDPTGIEIDHNGAMGSGDYADAIYFSDPRKVTAIDLLASVSPYGMTDPELEAAIEWYVRDYAGVETLIGSGSTISYTPQVFGSSTIIARLSFNAAIKGEQKLRVDYLPFDAGNAHVTYLSEIDKLPRDATSSGTLYTGETTRFSFTGIKYLDPTVEIKWYVNRQYVASGPVFDFKPKKAGDYVIGVQYGDRAPTNLPGVAFEAHVKPFILRPLDFSMLMVGVGLFVALTAVGVVIVVKRKKANALPAAETEPQEEQKPRKKKREKRDKNVKIAKR